ncbi:MAG: ATP phosphoribosyltransferase [Bacillota bacterium]
MLKIAIAKGRTAEKVQKLLQQTEDFGEVLDLNTRKLIFKDEAGQVQFILVKPTDLPIYVENGAADIGIVGKDVLMEKNCSICEVYDMKISNCIIAIAGPDRKGDMKNNIRRIATKYPNIAADYFRKRGEPIEIIKLDGSVELAPLIGLSDAIVDIVESGDTLRENNLKVYEKLCDISTRVVVNKVSYKLRFDEVTAFVDSIRRVLEVR